MESGLEFVTEIGYNMGVVIQEPPVADHLGALSAPAPGSQVVVLDEVCEGAWWFSFGVNAVDPASAVCGALQLLREAAADEGLWLADPRPNGSASLCRQTSLRRPG